MQLEETLDRDARFRGRARHLDADAGLLVEPLLATAQVLAPAERRKELRGRAGERNARTDEPQPRVAHHARRGAAQPGVRRTDRATSPNSGKNPTRRSRSNTAMQQRSRPAPKCSHQGISHSGVRKRQPASDSSHSAPQAERSRNRSAGSRTTSVRNAPAISISRGAALTRAAPGRSSPRARRPLERGPGAPAARAPSRASGRPRGTRLAASPGAARARSPP